MFTQQAFTVVGLQLSNYRLDTAKVGRHPADQQGEYLIAKGQTLAFVIQVQGRIGGFTHSDSLWVFLVDVLCWYRVMFLLLLWSDECVC